MNRFLKNTGFYLIIFLVTVGIVHFISSQNETTDRLSYDELSQLIDADNVEQLTLRYEGASYLTTGKYRVPPSGAQQNTFYSRVPAEEFAIQEIKDASEKERV